MTEAQAQAQLEMMVQSSLEPTLSSDEIQAILNMVKVVDSNGYAPTSALWTGTYDLRRAAAEGWRLKAAKAASYYAFSDSGASYNRQQIYDHCISIMKEYSKGSLSSVNVRGYLSTLDSSVVVNG